MKIKSTNAKTMRPSPLIKIKKLIRKSNNNS